MWLQCLLAKNFRLLQHFSVEFQSGVSVLIGANNAGKSNIIDAILLFKEALIAQINDVFNRRGGFQRIVSRHQVDTLVDLTFSLWQEAEPLLTYRVALSKNGLETSEFSSRGRVYRLQCGGGQQFTVSNPGGGGSTASANPTRPQPHSVLA
jgi:predicted ATPase